MTYAKKFRIYQEAAVPETPVTVKDDMGYRVIRLVSIVLASMAWKGKFDAAGLLALSGDFEDYVHGDDDLNDADLIRLITGIQRK